MPEARRGIARSVIASALAAVVVSGVVSGVSAVLATAAHADTPPAVTLAANPALETARGPARTSELSDGGFVSTFAFGTVVRHNAQGGVVWSRTSSSLYSDWKLQWQHPTYVESPQLPWGTSPVDPLAFSGGDSRLVGDTSPDAVGDLTGDGVPDIAVADVVGVNTTRLSSCGPCAASFNVPGSDLHLGTFVTVMDGRTGRTLYSELDPGYVTQVAIVGARLIVGDETGDPQRNGGIGAWGSMTTVHALHLLRDGSGYAAHQDWRFSTHAPWARLLGVVGTGGGGLAVAWSDTPSGLGSPAPPHGHVVLLDARSGHPRWDKRTPDYPVLIAADPTRHELVVVQVADVLQRTGYEVGGMSLTNGAGTVSSARSGALPLSLDIADAPGTATPAWLVASVDATVVANPLSYIPHAGRVSSVDPRTGRERWSSLLPNDGALGIAQPGGLVTTGGAIVVGDWLGNVTPSATVTRTEDDGVAGLSPTTGTVRWHTEGAVGDPLSLSAAGTNSVRAIDGGEVVRSYAVASGAAGRVTPEQGDILSTVGVVASAGPELVAGDQSGAVYAYTPAALAARQAGGSPKPRWQAVLPGAVRALQAGRIGNQPVVVAAATNAVAIIDADTGHVLHTITIPAAFVWTVTVGTAGSTPAVFVPAGSTLAAYALATGKQVWSYQAPADATFANASVSAGVVLSEYSSAASRTVPATHMAAVGLDAATGTPKWTVAGDPSTTLRGQLWNGVIAGAQIPSAGGTGAAFAWQTSSGAGRIDVRNAQTGALDYSNTSNQLSLHTSYVLSAATGLVATSQSGSVRIAAAGPVVDQEATALSGAAADDGTGTSDLLVANTSVSIYPTNFDSGTDPLDSEYVFNSGQLTTVDLGSGPTLVATPDDWLGYRIVNAASGYTIGASLETLQHGLALMAPTTTSLSSRGAAPRTPAAQPPTPPTGSAPASPAPDPEPVRRATVSPQARVLPHADAAAATPYTPATVQANLGLKGNGAGQTIAIVDAFHDPSIVADAETFSEKYGLPGVCGSGGTAGDCFTLTVAGQSSSTNQSWALETALDVEWTHVVAPKAHIVLVQAADGEFSSLFAAVKQATALAPAAVSMSWGVGFEFSDETYYDHYCTVSSTMCVVATGDYGHPGAYPAYNPAVLGVGGTTLDMNAGGTVNSEQTWSDSGGGTSWVEPPAAAQRVAESVHDREIPDVSFDANPQTGVAVYDGQPIGSQSGWFQVGGTSLGAPVWSALLADANQLRARADKPPLTSAKGRALKAVYSLPSGALADITTGPANGFCPAGCTAGPGFDQVTGLGTPRAGIDAALAGAGA